MSSNDTRTVSLQEAIERVDQGEYHHDPAAPDGPSLGADFWKDAEVVVPEPKTPISLRVDNDVLAFFKEDGPGYQTRMNAVLRSFMEARRKAG